MSDREIEEEKKGLIWHKKLKDLGFNVRDANDLVIKQEFGKDHVYADLILQSDINFTLTLSWDCRTKEVHLIRHMTDGGTLVGKQIRMKNKKQMLEMMGLFEKLPGRFQGPKKTIKKTILA